MTIKLFRNARIYTPKDKGKPLARENQGNINNFPHGAILVENGLIVDIGNEKEVIKNIESRIVNEEIDCQGKCLIPGFVDPHTHMCFAKRRESEFEMRIKGTPYLEILKQGGGILSSVQAVVQASENELYVNTKKHVLSALKF